MDLALYAPGVGYYARADQRSGRTGDFVTSVDLGPVFGALLAWQFADMWARMGGDAGGPAHIDMVEVAAGNGRLSRDILDAAERRYPAFYRAVAAHLVERSPSARAAQTATLAAHLSRVVSSSADVPTSYEGILFANELLDAFPVHVVQMSDAGLGEIYVDLKGDGFVERLAAPSTPALAAYLEDADVTLEPGTRGEINLGAVAWIADVAARLRRGFIVLVDYGHEAAELYSAARAQGTLATFHRHLVDAANRTTPAWLVDPGDRDLTSHVDLTSIRRAAERAGMNTLRVTDQTRFLLEIVEQSGLVEELSAPDHLRDRLALKTLLVPGGLGSTHKVMVFSKGIDYMEDRDSGSSPGSLDAGGAGRGRGPRRARLRGGVVERPARRAGATAVTSALGAS
jgi:SAM-dependent MidA family methyltransferase